MYALQKETKYLTRKFVLTVLVGERPKYFAEMGSKTIWLLPRIMCLFENFLCTLFYVNSVLSACSFFSLLWQYLLYTQTCFTIEQIIVLLQPILSLPPHTHTHTRVYFTKNISVIIQLYDVWPTLQFSSEFIEILWLCRVPSINLIC